MCAHQGKFRLLDRNCCGGVHHAYRRAPVPARPWDPPALQRPRHLGTSGQQQSSSEPLDARKKRTNNMLRENRHGRHTLIFLQFLLCLPFMLSALQNVETQKEKPIAKQVLPPRPPRLRAFLHTSGLLSCSARIRRIRTSLIKYVDNRLH